MPDAIRTSSEVQNYRVLWGVGKRDGSMRISAKPGMAAIEASANVSAIVVQNDVVIFICVSILADHSAGELGVGNLYLRLFVSRDTRVRNCNSPEHGGVELLRLGNRIDVPGFVADFVGNTRVGVCDGKKANQQNWGDRAHAQIMSCSVLTLFRKFALGLADFPKVNNPHLSKNRLTTETQRQREKRFRLRDRFVPRSMISRHGGTMTTKEFFTELDARIAKYDLLSHPFYKAWSAGELTRENLRDYARDYFHHVVAFPEYLQEFGSRVEDDQLRRVVFVNRDDEIGTGGSRSHAELWLDFIEGMGGERAENTTALPEIVELTESFHAIAREGSSEEALAAFYAYESQVPRVAKEKARGLREMYAADEKTCGYFTLHTTADIYHSRVWRHQLGKLVEKNPQAAEKALNAGENAAKALWNALGGIEAARTARAA